MAALAQGIAAAPPGRWLREFLREELAPYPGRMATVGRMVLATTLVILIVENFRIPFAFLGSLYTLLVSRDSPQASVRSAGTILLAAGTGAAYVLIGASFVISIPWLHFLWNISSFFLAFYVIATLTDSLAAGIFSIVIGIGVPYGTARCRRRRMSS